MMIQTERLILRQLTPADAPFILQLLNEPSWLQFIGDRGVRTLAEAEQYIINGPIAMYVEYGFGLYVVEQKENPQPMGLCGLIKRPLLEDVDIGFAFLPAFWGKGLRPKRPGGYCNTAGKFTNCPVWWRLLHWIMTVRRGCWKKLGCGLSG